MMTDEEAKLLDAVEEHFEELICGDIVEPKKDNGLEQYLLLQNFEMQLFWMRYALNTMHMSGEYAKYRTKVEKINNLLGKAERAIVRLKKEIQTDGVGAND